MQYRTLTPTGYSDLVVQLISAFEGHEPSARDIGDGKATIGYGYTFNRSDNVSIWTAAGIALSPAELSALAAIDAAAASARTSLAISTFPRTLSRVEAQALLMQTYPQYELPAIAFGMPVSTERAAFVSLTYNRGVGRANQMTQFATAISNSDRPEAWYQLRYNALGTTASKFREGVAKRRFVEAQIFGLYDDPASSTAVESKQIFGMLTKHRVDILKYESLYGVPPDGTGATRNMIAAANADANLSAIVTTQSLLAALTPARNAFVTWLNTQLPVDRQINASSLNPAAIYYSGSPVAGVIGKLDASGDNGKGAQLENNVMVGNTGADILIGGTGDDVLVGQEGSDVLEGGTGVDKLFGGADNDILTGGQGDDILTGGAGDDLYIWNSGDGNDTIVDPDGGTLIVNGANFKFGGGIMLKDPGTNIWRDPSGNVVLTHNSPWRIELPDGSIIQLGEDFDPSKWGITLRESISSGQPAPVTGGQILGDMAPLDTDPATEGVQIQLDALNNVITDPNQPQPDRADTLYDSTGDDEIIAGGGVDHIFTTRGGTNWVKAGSGRDTVEGGGGSDLIELGSERDYGVGGGGADTLYADVQRTVDEVLAQTLASTDDQADIMDGGGGDDTVMGDAGNDGLFGGEGKDLLVGGAGDDYMFGDRETIAVSSEWAIGRQASSSGGNLSGVLLVTTGITTQLASDVGADHMLGGAGNDFMLANGGDDYLDGGTGNDYMFGGTGADSLLGGDGNDTMIGDGYTTDASQWEYAATSNHGSDSLDGGTGDDILWGMGKDDVLYGGAGDDQLQGDAFESALAGEFHGNDYLDGGDGNDILNGDGKDDTLYGGAGNDTLNGDRNPSALAGEFHGNDYLDGGDGDDILIGGGKDDVLYGGAGNDELQGDSPSTALGGQYHGSDYLDGGDGVDTLLGGGGTDTLIGGTGDDQLQGDGGAALIGGQYHGNDYLDGGEGNDALWGDGGADTLVGGAGDDTLYGDSADYSPDSPNYLAAQYQGNDALDGGEGNDSLYGGGGDDTLYGGAGNDTLVGGEGADYLDGGLGNDTYQAGVGDRVVDAGGINALTLVDGAPEAVSSSGNDLVLDYGSRGTLMIENALGGSIAMIDGTSLEAWVQSFLMQDAVLVTTQEDQTLIGGRGDDHLTAAHDGAILRGGLGNDTFTVGGGNSIVDGGEGNDTVTAGDGNNMVSGGSGNDAITVGSGNNTLNGDDGNDTLVAGDGNNSLLGGSGNDSLTSGAGSDNLDGGYGNDTLHAGGGNDVLNGGDGDDMVYGDAGNDTLYASRGNDTLAGGDGLDTYVLGYSADRSNVVDDSAEGSVIKLGSAGMKFEDLNAVQRGNDLVVEVRGTSASMRIKDYYASTQTSWVFEDAQGNTTTGEALVAASQTDWAQLQANLLHDFQSSALGAISRSYSDSGYAQQADGSWYRADNYAMGIARTYDVRTEWSKAIHTPLNDPSHPWVSTSSYVSYAEWATQQWGQETARDWTATISFQANAIADGTGTIQSYSYATSIENAWSAVQWAADGSTHSESEWVYESSTGWPVENPTEAISNYTRYDIDSDYYTGTVGPLTYQDPGAAAQAGNLPDYVAVDFLHQQTGYNLGPSQLADGDQTVWADQYSAVIGGTGNNTIYGAGFAYGGTGNAQLIGGGTLMAGTGDQYLQDGNIMVVGDGHDTVVGLSNGEKRSRILVNPDNLGIDLISQDFDWQNDNGDNGQSEVIASVYKAMGIGNWEQRYQHGGKFFFDPGESSVRYFESIDAARAAFVPTEQWPTFDIALADPLTKSGYVDVLPVLYKTPYTTVQDPASGLVASSYYDSHPLATTLLTANDFAALQPLLDAELLPTGVISFGPGLALTDLTLSWGEAASPIDGATHVTLDILWGTDQGIRILIPRSGDALNSVAQQFEFSDGTVSSLQDLIAMAPPAPDFDTSYSRIYAGMGEQSVDAFDVAGIRAVVASAADLKVESDGVDLLISIIGSSGDSLRITDWYADPDAMSQAVLFTSGGAVLSAVEMTNKGLIKDGSAGDMDLFGVPDFATTFVAGPNTRMTGNSGMDIYVYNAGSGEVHITDPGGGAVRFGSGVSDTVTLGLGDGSLAIKLGDQGDTIYLENFDPTDAENFESVLDFEYADGSVLSLQDFLDQGFDLAGTSDADFISGTSVTDRILAGAGDDTLEGGAGNDVYLYSRGDGSDYIADRDETAGNFDTLRFDSTIAVSDIKVTRSLEELYLEIAGTSDRITLGEWFLNGGMSKIEQIEFDDGTVWDAAMLESLVVVGDASEGSDELAGTAGDDTINGLGGDDDLMGIGGNDTLDGGAGNDYLSGGAGSDVYLFGRGSGEDRLFEFDEAGSDIDTLRFDSTVEVADISITRDQAGTLSLIINGTDDKVQIDHWFAYDPVQSEQIERIEFHDGTVWSAQTLSAMATFLGTAGQDNLAGTEGNDMLRGLGGNDNLFGVTGADVLEGGDGDDSLSGMAGSSNYFNGGSGDDQMLSGAGANLFIGGAGNDLITSDSGADVFAFNVGDGQDTLQVNGTSQGPEDTISLGGAGLDYANLSLQKSGDDLVLKVSGTDQLTLTDWYASTPKQAVLNLQLVAEAMSAFDANSSDPLLNQKVQTFDFQGLVGAFDAARTATPGLSSWALSNGLTQFHLAGSDSEALGGDLAYHYGADGTLAGMGLGKAQEVLTNAQFGTQAQAIHSTASLQEGLVRLG